LWVEMNNVCNMLILNICCRTLPTPHPRQRAPTGRCSHNNRLYKRLGHKNAAITLSIYSHVMDGMDEDAAVSSDQMMNRIMGNR